MSGKGSSELYDHLLHELGIQSNILVSATYAGPTVLKPGNVFPALKAVVDEHPALWLVHVPEPSGKGGRHCLWDARVPNIRLGEHVSFVDEEPGGGDAEIARTFEKEHNSWFLPSPENPLPRWRIIIVGGKRAIFVFHHAIGDGISGYTFHRSFLAALNSLSSNLSPDSEPFNADSPVLNPRIELPMGCVEQIDDRLRWRYAIWEFLFWLIVRFFVNQRYFFFSDASYPKTYPTPLNPLPISKRTITSTRILRIDKETMSKALNACRRNKTSFTALLHTLIQVTLAADFYPKAVLGFSSQAVNIRPQLRTDPGIDVVMNAVGVYPRVQFLSSYRKAGMSRHNPDSENAKKFGVNEDMVWGLAKSYKAHMQDFVWKERSAVQESLLVTLLGEEIEGVTFYGLGLFQNNSFLISNLGVFEPKATKPQENVSRRNKATGLEEDEETEEQKKNGGWEITDIAFSAATVRASLGVAGIVFNVASLRGGDCVVCAGWEEGVLREEMVSGVLEGVGGRLRALIET
jgi:hypothetical protein